MLKCTQPLTLASRSPRRLWLLRSIGIEPQVIPRSYGKERLQGGGLRELAESNAYTKFTAASRRVTGWLLTADTLVGCQGRVLGKPVSADEAKEMLRFLSGHTHEVITAYCLGYGGEANPRLRRHVTSYVTFHRLTDVQIADYVESGEPMDKAGGYGLQQQGGRLVASVDGSHSNVIGLPLLSTAFDLVRLGIACFAAKN